MHIAKHRFARLSAQRLRLRRAAGDFLVEFLVAVLVMDILAAALVQSLAQTHSTSTGAQGQLLAAAIAQEVMDAARITPYDSLETQLGNHQITVNGNGTIAGDPFFPRPLLQDFGNYRYSAAGLANSFQAQNNQVTVSIRQATINTVLVSVTVNWTDSTGPHVYATSTVVARYGITS